MDRRQMLGGTAAAVSLAAMSGSALAAQRPYRVGVVGAGWMGMVNLHALMQVAPVEAVALCDVDHKMLVAAAETVMKTPDSLARPTRKPALYRDYRAMLSAHKFDIVLIGTPDHWHTLPAIAAMKAGAHVYLEKPICIDVMEGRAMLQTARATGRMVQVGTQRRTLPAHIEARERIVQSGLIGKVGYIEIHGYYHQRPPVFPPATNPPPTLDWNFYCGPAPFVPYHPEIHPIQWRAFREFGNGYIADLGVHFVDTCRWMLGLDWPKRISSVGGVFVDKKSISTVPDTQTAQFEYDDLLLSWGNREWGEIPDGVGGPWGATLYGDKGTLKLGSQDYEFKPVDGSATLTGASRSDFDKYPHDRELNNTDRGLIVLTRYHMIDFVHAIETKTLPAADIEQGYISTSTVILANLSLDLGRPIRWDGSRVIGDDEAQQRLTRAYRAPWIHPAAA